MLDSGHTRVRVPVVRMHVLLEEPHSAGWLVLELNMARIGGLRKLG